MDEITKIKQLLAEGIVMSSNVDNPTLSEHRTLEYCELAQKK